MVDRLALADLTSVFIAVAEGIPRQAGQMGRGSGFRPPFKGGGHRGLYVQGHAVGVVPFSVK